MEKKVSVARACRVVKLDRSMFYYALVSDDSEVEEKLRDYGEKLPARGFPGVLQAHP